MEWKNFELMKSFWMNEQWPTALTAAAQRKSNISFLFSSLRMKKKKKCWLRWWLPRPLFKNLWFLMKGGCGICWFGLGCSILWVGYGAESCAMAPPKEENNNTNPMKTNGAEEKKGNETKRQTNSVCFWVECLCGALPKRNSWTHLS